MKSNKMFKMIVGSVVALFILILVLGIVRFYSHESPHVKATEAQLTAVKELVTDDFVKQGKNISAYELEIPPKLRSEREDNLTTLIAQVSVENESDSQIYLIDLNTNTIVMHSQTEFYNGFLNKRRERFQHLISERDYEDHNKKQDRDKENDEKKELPAQ